MSASVKPEVTADESAKAPGSTDARRLSPKTQLAPLGLPSPKPKLRSINTSSQYGNKSNDFSVPLSPPPLSAVTSERIDLPGSPGGDGDQIKSSGKSTTYVLYQFKGRGSVSKEIVPTTRDSMNSGDVFIMDMRSHPLNSIVRWCGSQSNRQERKAAKSFAEQLQKEHFDATGTTAVVVQLMDRERPSQEIEDHAEAFWAVLGGYGPIKSAEEALDDRSYVRNVRISQKQQQRRDLLRSMSRSQSIRYLVKEKISKTSRILHSKYWTTWITVLTIYALFGDDMRYLTTFKPADTVFYSISCIALAFFTLELILNGIAQPTWCFGFYFWLDLAATISLIPDIGWIWDPLLGAFEGDDSGGGGSTLKVGRASRAGTKAGRIVRIVRLVRMVRMVKLYKMHGQNQNEDHSRLERRLKQKESKVGAILSERTTRKVIVLVLMLILLLPQFDGLGEQDDAFQTYGLSNLHSLAQDFNCDGRRGHADNGTYVVDRDLLFKPIVQSYARSAGRLMHLNVSSMDPLLTLPGRNPWNTTQHWISNAGWTSEVDYEIMANPRDTEDLQVRFPATWSTHTPWGDVNYTFALHSEDYIDKWYRPTEAPRVEIFGCLGVFAANNCQDPDANIGVVTVPSASDTDYCVSIAIFNAKPEVQLAAGLNIVKTLFVMLVLVYGAVSFQNDAQKLVIGPIERMMDTVKMLAENPLAKTMGGPSVSQRETDSMAKKRYETALLEQTIEKVSTLMQVGFGAAGAEIIGANMQAADGAVDPMVDGVVITSIYGFCDIRKFTDTTECLQEQVMTYVNSLGTIVHGATHRWYGMANKNVGDAFLLSWKICDGLLPGFHEFMQTQHGKGFYEFDECQRLRAEHAWRQGQTLLDGIQSDKIDLLKKLHKLEGVHHDVKRTKAQQEEIDFLKEELKELENELDAPPMKGAVKPARPGKGSGKRSRAVGPIEMADSAFAAFVTACVDLRNANVGDGCLVQFINNERVIKRFGQGFTIKMGFGMHVGWCVQGAIGSTYKIDCTYLSPHVEMSDRLEAGSKIFNTPMNLSHWMVALMSPTVKQHLRAIDRIKVSGVPVPMTVYTFDIFNYDACHGEPFRPSIVKGMQQPVNFISDPTLSELQMGMDPDFLPTFRSAYASYIDGDWARAKELLESVLQMRSPNQKCDPETGAPLPDGPSTQLMNFMGQTNFVAPADWDGIHNLDGY